MSRSVALALSLSLLAVTCPQSQAQVTLYGMTGNQGNDDQTSFPDATLFTINVDDASSALVKTLTGQGPPEDGGIGDSHIITFNPNQPNLLYHFAGGESWTDDSSRVGGFRDHHYLESFDLTTEDVTPIFNANPAPSPDDFPAFGLPAPIPSFILPEEQRLEDDPGDRERGENEYHSYRGITWSDEEGVWYASDELGFFRVSPAGDPEFIGQPLDEPRDMKGIVFYESDAGTQLLATTKKTASLWSIDTQNGEALDDPIELQPPEGSPFDDTFDGVLGMAQHPDTGVLYGIRRIADDDVDGQFERELITIDPTSGDTTLVGSLGLHFTSLVFVSSGEIGDFNGNGLLDAADIDELTANLGGASKYDLNGDQVVDGLDREFWVNDIKKTYFGDANLDLEFNSSDLVEIFQAGQYEDDTDGNSTWATGDWNGDGDFDSGDLVTAFQAGGFESGPRPAPAAVPEPSSIAILLVTTAGLILRRK